MAAADFKKAVEYVQNAGDSSNSKLTNDDKLKFYALFKQATVGKCNTAKPSRLSIVNYAKWSAWNKLGNMKRETAKKNYVAALESKMPDWNKPKAKL
eukprot:CAMPEP_0201508112 /NCGR_PEP_ID=MMETSP0161_2-20130828/1566_1 /ASSEMBLY_ACC=CAM_ASM_000251 /TAXON_ID=180227 /ORGANISM="Neoparamoeba aestuarina, Strain SoJaBio B1-5/56/2" /LENGTH=96 /DNA_ID=CAMNT_0047902661 /DNA_START=54 /DNA_END=344 /DNA_ORIENTATION=+